MLDDKIVYQLEGIDRMYMNGYAPYLQTEGGIANFFRKHREMPFASSVLMSEISKQFVSSIERFAEEQKIPYNVRFYLNGHEYLKRQLTQKGIAYEPLDNGLFSCAEPRKAQQICDGPDEKKIDKTFRK